MTEMDWRRKYAPNGYAYLAHRIPFEDLELRHPGMTGYYLQHLLMGLHRRLASTFPEFDEGKCFTRISVYEKQIGESLAHLDPLVPRFGLEVEVRWPVVTVVHDGGRMIPVGNSSFFRGIDHTDKGRN